MEQCKKCDLAIYCFSEPNTWIFRTKQEMEEKRKALLHCPVYQKNFKESSEASLEQLKTNAC